MTADWGEVLRVLFSPMLRWEFWADMLKALVPLAVVQAVGLWWLWRKEKKKDGGNAAE